MKGGGGGVNSLFRAWELLSGVVLFCLGRCVWQEAHSSLFYGVLSNWQPLEKEVISCLLELPF